MYILKKVRPKKYVFFTFIATLLCMLTIFILSAQPAPVSDGNSKGILQHIVEFVVKVTGTNIPDQQKIQLVGRINSSARELMHAVVYFVLGIFAQLTVMGFIDKKLLSGLYTLLFCVAYGISDEIHQLFVPGRAFQLFDIAMDTAGAALAVLLVIMIKSIIYRKRQSKINAQKSITRRQ